MGGVAHLEPGSVGIASDGGDDGSRRDAGGDLCCGTGCAAHIRSVAVPPDDVNGIGAVAQRHRVDLADFADLNGSTHAVWGRREGEFAGAAQAQTDHARCVPGQAHRDAQFDHRTNSHPGIGDEFGGLVAALRDDPSGQHEQGRICLTVSGGIQPKLDLGVGVRLRNCLDAHVDVAVVVEGTHLLDIEREDVDVIQVVRCDGRVWRTRCPIGDIAIQRDPGEVLKADQGTDLPAHAAARRRAARS